MKTLNLAKLLTDDEVDKLKGHFINESHIKYNIVDTDTDCYNEEGKLLFKFRKNVLSQELCDLAWKNYKDLAKASRGRGNSAGQIDPNIVNIFNYWLQLSNKLPNPKTIPFG